MFHPALRSRFVALTLGASVALGASLSAASVITRQTAPIYIAKFSVASDMPTDYTGTTTFSIDKDGKVSGKMALDVPVDVHAALGGAVKDDVWTFEYTYAIPQQACEGTVTGTAKVSKDRKLVQGTVKIGGACTQTPLDATFSFTQKDKGLRPWS